MERVSTPNAGVYVYAFMYAMGVTGVVVAAPVCGVHKRG